MKQRIPRSIPRTGSLSVAVIVFLAGLAQAGLALPADKAALLPPPAAGQVDFARDIQPIFEASCVQCHARGKSKGAFSLETRTDFIEGGDSGPAAISGKSAKSYVVEMISGLNPEVVMPKKGKKLIPAQVAVFRAWIDQGMPWPKEITFFKHEPANLRPVELAEPPAAWGLKNPLDRFVDRVFKKYHVAWKKPVDDRTYARRVWLDAIGLLPPPDELEAFVADTARDKRARLVERLLNDNQRYAEHWLTFWNDLLRNDYKGAGYIDGGRKQITTWLYTALARNLPYDQFVAQLLNPGIESDGFTKGILWRGAVNASMVPSMQASQGIAQVFLGVNLKCASCHDSFINEYTLQDSYGLASIYANGPLEIAECDKPTGHLAQVKFLYAELGAIDAKGSATVRKQQLVEIITGRKNGRLPRTVVNRIWQRFMGYGLVEPVDEMDKPAWSPELLDWLAEDLVAHGFDLKHTMARILTSRAYQLPAVDLGETAADYVFRGPAVRRLSAEQFSDAIMTLAGMNYPKADARLNRAAALRASSESDLPLRPKWIWSTAGAEVKAKSESVVFRQVVTLPQKPVEAWLTIVADDHKTLKVNGQTVGSVPGRRASTTIEWSDAAPHLIQGDNIIEVTAVNIPPEDKPAEELTRESDNPAGLLLYARVRAPGAVMDFVSDRYWSVITPELDESEAVELGGMEMAPWKVGRYFLDVAASSRDALPVQRAALVAADPLMVALGRPNREQVVTVRQSTATTLQALEMTNGRTFAVLLGQGAEKILSLQPASSRVLVEELYRQTLSRPPTGRERKLAEQIVGSPAKAEGVQDLLWTISMLPEFQLIR